VEACGPALALESQLRGHQTAPSTREKLLEAHSVQPQARRVEPRQDFARHRGLPGPRHAAPAARAAALPRLASREEQPHPHPPGQNQLLAPRVEAQGRDLDDRALRLPLEDTRQKPSEIRRGPPRRNLPDRTPARTHGAVPEDLHFSLAEGARDEAGEAHPIHGADPAELHPAADDGVDQGAAEGQRCGLGVGREVEAGDENAHAA
jgi:hypothetical protein